MAEIAITSVISKVVDISAALLDKQGSRLNQLQENINWIVRELRNIQSYLEDAEARKSESRGVANLMKDIEDLASDVEDILYTFLPQIESHRSSSLIRKAAGTLCYVRTCRSFAVEIENIKQRVNEIDRTRRTYGIKDTNGSSFNRFQLDRRGASLHVNEPIIVGFDRQVEELKARLLSTNLECCFISIVGLPGLGKTTLAKKIFNGVKENFECSALVCVSEEPSIIDILKNVAKQVGLEKEKQEENLEANLFAFLQEKRFVIFFDDIWHIESWDTLRLGIPTHSQNGSRIIITSRNSGVGRYVGSESSLHVLEPLDFENSWELFTKLIASSLTKGLEDIGKQIIERCGGMPLAIVVTVGMLRERETSDIEWKSVLKNIGQDDQDKCLKILALSYKDLPTVLKPCFLYLGLYPEDHEIRATQLIHMWTAEKFLQGIGDLEPEDVGEEYVKKLVARNLIQVVSRRFDGRVRSCRIHDLLRSLCINLAKENNFFYTLDHLNSSSAMRARRLVARHHSNNEYFALNLKTPKLRAFFFSSNKNEKIPRKHLKSFLSDFRILGVLSLESHFLYLRLPNEIGNLSQLTCFRLNVSFAKVPCAICKLRKLQTFDIQECLFVDLPMCIWKIKELRHLLLCDIRFSSFNWGFRSKTAKLNHRLEVSLPYLQTLVGIKGEQLNRIWLRKFRNLRKLEVKYSPRGIIEELSHAEPISAKLENLRLRSSIFGDDQTVRLDLSRYQNLVRLRIGYWMKKLPNADEFPPNLIKLTIELTFLEEDPMEVLKKLPKLKILKLGSDSYKGTKMDCSGAYSFLQLELLQFRRLWELEKVIADEEGMPKLKEVIISGCHRLEMIPEKLENVRKYEK
ncbi:disease resistance protein RPP13-like [Olea europaea var. sylvestris]|uniref:disease resistance protein RPP13-like n=1 Tax=Olea europaea var. sylvestris TaxID=158386 RepID=UPI000C1D7C97|nr:disease resistance protein RPP13-like [Olea europaea var. sylvestris]